MNRDAWNERYRAREDLVWAEAPNRFVEAECAGLTPGRALDLACGEGRNAVWLAGLGWQVTAVDWADVAVAKGEDLATRKGVTVDWVVSDLMTYEPEAASYDLVLLSYLQVPPADLEVVWPRALAAVAPGGSFLVVAHHPRNLTEGWGGPSSPAVLYSPGDVVAAIEAHGGFDVLRADDALRPVELDGGGTATAIDTLVRATRRAR